MTVFQLYIIATVFGLSFSSILIYFLQTKKEKKAHLYTMHILKTEQEINKKQIAIRARHLAAYDFLKQNLNESLHTQSEIELFT